MLTTSFEIGKSTLKKYVKSIVGDEISGAVKVTDSIGPYLENDVSSGANSFESEIL